VSMLLIGYLLMPQVDIKSMGKARKNSPMRCGAMSRRASRLWKSKLANMELP